jgi:anti-sigma B factor antagonist
MTLEFRELTNGVRIIKLDGNLDIAGVDTVEKRFCTHCAGNLPRVLVDLSAIGFVTSLGIRMLLQGIKIVSARGGRLLMLNPSRVVTFALEISGLGQFVVRGSEADGVAALLEPGK